VPGSEVVLEAGAHIFNYEEAAGAALSGLQFQTVPTENGLLSPDLIRRAIRPDSPYMHSTSLIAIENTHNGAGGKILPLEDMQGIRQVADEAGLPIHLDGARLWHACAASGFSPAEYGATADTVMVCLSKGLGAPVGSLLAGTEALMARAWRIRRRLGGGMRQSGILAAAGIFALENNRERLKDDHARAKALAEGARKLPGVQALIPDTNIVMLDFPEGGISVGEILGALADEGVLMVPFGPTRVRAVTHLDVDDDGVTKALEALGRVVRGRSG
jgi:threonine aldolase